MLTIWRKYMTYLSNNFDDYKVWRINRRVSYSPESELVKNSSILKQWFDRHEI